MKRLATFLLLAICFSGSIAGSEVKRPRVLGLSHIALFVSDLGKARAFYEDFLGYQEPYVLKREDGSDRIVFVKINESRPARKGYASPIEVKVGKDHLRRSRTVAQWVVLCPPTTCTQQVSKGELS